MLNEEQRQVSKKLIEEIITVISTIEQHNYVALDKFIMVNNILANVIGWALACMRNSDPEFLKTHLPLLLTHAEEVALSYMRKDQ